MKKLCVFVLLLASFGCVAVFKTENNPLFSFDSIDKICFVSSEKFDEASCVQCGDLMFNFCSLQTAKQNLKKYQKNSQAIQVYFSTFETKDILKKLNATILSENFDGDLKVTVAYSPLFQGCVFVDGKKANLQFAEKDGKLIVGMPAILTGF